MTRKTIHLFNIAAVGLALALGAPLANAQDPKGPGDRPPGWEKGKKEGWGGADSPPGLEKKDQKKKSGQTKPKKKPKKEQKKDEEKAGKDAEKG